jgi:hypothetical protein
VRIKDCLVTIAGLIESFGLGSPYHAAEDGPVDISLREIGARYVRARKIRLDQVGRAEIGARHPGAGQAGE